MTSVRTSDSQRSFMILKKLLWWSFHLSKNSSWLILIELIVSEYLKMCFRNRREHKLEFTWCFQVPLHLKCYLLKPEQIHSVKQFLVSTIFFPRSKCRFCGLHQNWIHYFNSKIDDCSNGIKKDAITKARGPLPQNGEWRTPRRPSLPCQ